MLVYVTTTKTIESAFNAWIDDADDDEQNRQRQIVVKVYQWFMASPEAKRFQTITGLISFPLDTWEAAYWRWIDKEITAHPENETNIRLWSGQLITLMSSSWSRDHKLIVRECLDALDFQIKLNNLE